MLSFLNNDGLVRSPAVLAHWPGFVILTNQSASMALFAFRRTP